MIRSGAGVLLVGLALGGCGETTGPELLLDSTVRVLHAAPETPRLEVVLDDELRTVLDYAEVSDHITMEGGSEPLRLVAEGETEALIDLDSDFESGRQYTVLAAGRQDEILPVVLIDDPTPADTGETRLRVVHAAPTAGVVDVYVSEPGTALETESPDAAAVAFGEASDYMVMESRTYQVRVTSAGGGETLVDLPLLVLSSLRVVTLVIMDTRGSGPPHGIIVLNDRPR